MNNKPADQSKEPGQLALNKSDLPSYSITGSDVPLILATAGEDAVLRFVEFFAVTIRNKHTRRAYLRNAMTFLRWCEDRGISSLNDIKPMTVAAYIELLQETHSKPTVKQQLASIRMLLDWLVTGHAIQGNPAHAVCGPKHVVTRGKTPVLTADETRTLFESIKPETVVDFRDRALMASMFFTFARVGAVLSMSVEDYYPQGKRYWLRLQEKNGREHQMPAHHTLEEYLDAYLNEAKIASDGKGPLFRTATRKGDALTANPMLPADVWRMIRRRTRKAGIQTRINCHSFRATGITNYLDHGGTLEKAQQMASHASPRTTKLYDRTNDQVTLDEVEKITL